MINHFLVRLYFVLLSSELYLLTLAKTDYPSIIFDSDSVPLPGFTQIQYQCKSSSTWVNHGGW